MEGENVSFQKWLLWSESFTLKNGILNSFCSQPRLKQFWVWLQFVDLWNISNPPTFPPPFFLDLGTFRGHYTAWPGKQGFVNLFGHCSSMHGHAVEYSRATITGDLNECERISVWVWGRGVGEGKEVTYITQFRIRMDFCHWREGTWSRDVLNSPWSGRKFAVQLSVRASFLNYPACLIMLM